MRQVIMFCLLGTLITLPSVSLADLPPCTRGVATPETTPQTDLILKVPALGKSKYGLDDNRRCNVASMAVAVRDNGVLRDIYTPGTNKPDSRVADDNTTASNEKTLTAPTSDDEKRYIKGVIDAIRTNAKSAYDHNGKQPVKILIFAHGGMVSHRDAVLNAEALAPAMMRDNIVPVFLIWNSDLPVSYWDRLCCVRDGFRATGSRTWYAPIRLIGDVGSSLVTAPENYSRQAVRFKQSVLDKKNKNYYLGKAWLDYDCRYFGDGSKACDNIVLPEFTGDTHDVFMNDNHRGSFAKETAYVAMLPTRVVTTALGAKVGASAWDNMLRRTRLGFNREEHHRNCGDIDEQRHEDLPPPHHLSCPNGGFTLFFDALTGIIKPTTSPTPILATDSASVRTEKTLRAYEIKVDDGTYVPVTLEFYGHSMGAIVGNETLRHYPNLPWSRVVYMAAASTIRDFKLTAAPVIIRHKIPFYNLTLHPLNESRELNAWGAVPQGSLLEWIDEMFEGPKSLEDRTLGKWKNIESTLPSWNKSVLDQMTVRVFPKQFNLIDNGPNATQAKSEKLYYSEQCAPYPPAGETEPPEICHPIKHGEFNDYTFWRQRYLTQSAEVAPLSADFLDKYLPSDERKMQTRMSVVPEVGSPGL